MKKVRKPKQLSLAVRLESAERQVNAALDEQNRLRKIVSDLTVDNTHLVKLVEDLKEHFYNKSIALAHAEGQLQRVDHEDAERAEVVMIEDIRTTKVQHEGGFEVNGPAVPIKRAVLKYNLDGSPPRMTMGEEFYRPSTSDSYGRAAIEKPKHWVNRR